MHRYFPHTPEDEARMLAVAGAESVEALFDSVPPACRPLAPLNMPAPLTEWELRARAADLAASMAPGAAWVGAGSYDHHIPAVVPALAGRSEFVTSYTPYQAEMSQGTLQGIFEFQTLIARLFGMEVANASMYDGATATAEGALMACRLTKRNTLAVSSLLHPHYRAVLQTYCTRAGLRYVELPASSAGKTDLASLDAPEAAEPAAVVLQSPNFFGVVEDVRTAAETVHARKGLLVACVTEPLSLALTASPGSLGADIACGEGQSLGLPQGFGGPGLGLLTTRKAFVRNIPGRLVGLTADNQGRRAFVLTLATREQHIRREKAVSNICSNAGLCAMTCAVYLASLGGTGLRELARLNRDKAEYLKAGLLRQGFTSVTQGPTFNEFVLRAPEGFDRVHKRLVKEKRVLFGLDVTPWYPDCRDCYLFCVTETRSRADMDDILKEIAQ